MSSDGNRERRRRARVALVCIPTASTSAGRMRRSDGAARAGSWRRARRGCWLHLQQQARGAHTGICASRSPHKRPTDGRVRPRCEFVYRRRYTPTRARAASSARSPRLRGRRRARAAASASGAAARETRGGGGAEGPTPARRATTRASRRDATASASARRARRARRAPPPAVAGIGRRAPARRRGAPAGADAPSTRRPSARAPSMLVESAPYIMPSASSVPSTWSSAHVPEIGAAYIPARRWSSRWQVEGATTCRRRWSRRVDGGDARGAARAQGGAASAAAAAARRAAIGARARTSIRRHSRASRRRERVVKASSAPRKNCACRPRRSVGASTSRENLPNGGRNDPNCDDGRTRPLS